MQLKKIAEIVLVSLGILALSACSHTKKHDPNATGQNDMALASAAGHHSGYDDATNARHLAKNTFYFDFDKSTIRDSDKPIITANAEYLIAHPHAKILILEGHTDPRGSREYNVGLGERRAQAIAELLKAKGVNANQIRIVSYGSERRGGAGYTESDYQLDRRAVITRIQA